MNHTLPETIEVGGVELPIMWDYRPILDVLTALDDPELSDQDKVFCALYIFYPGFENIRPEDIKEAAEKMFWFINGGENDTGKRGPKLMDWEQDFRYIVAPINRVYGSDIRKGTTESNPIHWWSILSAYYEIGDCTFAQIVRIRDLKARGKLKEKSDREWYNRNRDLVDFKNKYTQKDKEALKEFLGI